jgi:hypothetical protein
MVTRPSRGSFRRLNGGLERLQEARNPNPIQTIAQTAVTFLNNDPSIAAQVTRITGLSKKPDLVFFCSYAAGQPSKQQGRNVQTRASLSLNQVNGDGASRGLAAACNKLVQLYRIAKRRSLL